MLIKAPTEVSRKNAVTQKEEDKQGTVQGQENEEAGDRDDPSVSDRKQMSWDRTAEIHHGIQTLLHLPGHQIFAKHHRSHKLLGILHGILTGRQTGARRSKQCFIPNSVAGKPGAQTPIQAAPGFWHLHLVEEEPDLHIPWPNHSPAHGSGYSWERECSNSMSHSNFPLVWEQLDSQGRRYPVFLRLQCRMKYPNIWENSDGKYLQQPEFQDKRKGIKIPTLSVLEYFQPVTTGRGCLPDLGMILSTSQELPRNPGVEVWSRRLYNSPEISSSIALWLQKIWECYKECQHPDPAAGWFKTLGCSWNTVQELPREASHDP